MRYFKLCLAYITIQIAFPVISLGQVSNFRKTITFNSITIPSGSCYIDHDGGSGWGGAEEDPAIVIRCDNANGPVVFSKTWTVNIPSAGTYNLVNTAFQCSPPANSFSIDPVNILAVSSINLWVSTFERENSSCDNTNNQACNSAALRTFNLNAGTYALNCGNITYNYTVVQSPSTTPSNFCNMALPIELSQFEVTPFGVHAEITWQTSSERNNDYFTIERSTDGVHWEERKQIKGAGNSTDIINYSALDENWIIGITYYRLKQTDFNGEFSYSDIKSYRSEINDQINVYPNPVYANTLYLYGDNIGPDAIRIYDLYGRDVSHQVLVTQQESSFVLDVSQIHDGNYFLSTGTKVVKFSKQ